MVVVVMDDAPSSSSYPSTRSLMLDTADGFVSKPASPFSMAPDGFKWY